VHVSMIYGLNGLTLELTRTVISEKTMIFAIVLYSVKPHK